MWVNDQSVMIARRSVSLSKTYTILGILMAIIGVGISGLGTTISNLGTLSNIPINGVNGLKPAIALTFVSIALQVMAAILFSTSVLLLYVYDKNNGVLEYFLSLGMTQGDVFRHYLKAALILCSGIVGFEVVINLAVGLVEGTSGMMLLEVTGLVIVLALPVVSLETLIMMSFSSLQKQRVGSNQPLGMAIGVLMVMPTYIVGFAVPSLAVEIDLLTATIIAVLTLTLYFFSSSLISREKLLP